MKKFYFISLFFIFSLDLSAQNLQQKIATAVENRDYSDALTQLQNLEKSDKKTFTINNYDYLSARLAEKRGDLSLAMAKYQTVVRNRSVLSPYAFWHLSQISRSTGNLMQERFYLQRLLITEPTSLLTDAVNDRLARSYFESGNYEQTIGLLTAGFPNRNAIRKNADSNPVSNDARSRERSVLLGNAYLRSKRNDDARGVFTDLVTNLPNTAQPDDFALESVRGLDLLDGFAGTDSRDVPLLSDSEYFRRALIYQFNRNFASARQHYLAIVQHYPESVHLPQALYQIGRGFTLELNYSEAVKWFERLQSEFPDDPLSENALSQAASAYARLNKTKEAVARYQKVIDKYPDANSPERAFLNIIDVERDLGEDSSALSWASRTREAFKGKLPEAVALFAQIRIEISKNNWVEALRDLLELERMTDLGGTSVPGGTNRNEVAFLRGFVLEQLGRYSESIETYLSIPDGRNEYYGWRATERLRNLALDESSKETAAQKFKALADIGDQSVTPQNADNIRRATQSAIRLTDDINVRKKFLEILKQTYAALPAYRAIPAGKLVDFGRKELVKERKLSALASRQAIADELLFLGLYDEGAPELETVLREKLSKNTNALTDFPAETAYTLAVYYNRGEMSNLSIRYIEPQWKNIPADYQIELIPTEQIALLYPIPFSDSLIKYAPDRNVDPRFVLSIMRQESRYRADVKSVAAARGLMQFISDTSGKIAIELGKENFNQDDLYHPPTAILFGSQYLGNLYQVFPNQPQAVAASYNAGEHNMIRWVARSKSDDPDRYVPEIIFSQSKDYVYKVMTNFRVYQVFFDEKLNLR